MRISDWSSDVCSSDLAESLGGGDKGRPAEAGRQDGRQVAGLARRGGQQALAEGDVGAGGIELVLAQPVGKTAAGDHRMPGDRRPDSVGVDPVGDQGARLGRRSEEHTSELQSLMRSSYAVFSLKTKNTARSTHRTTN